MTIMALQNAILKPAVCIIVCRISTVASYYFNQALEINKRQKNEAGIAASYHNMGMVADNIGKSSSALDNYFKSLSLDIKLRDNLASANNYNDIGVRS